MYSGSSDGESHEAAQRKIPPASSMLWVRNLRRFIGSGTGLGSEALMGNLLSLILKFLLSNLIFYLRKCICFMDIAMFVLHYNVTVVYGDKINSYGFELTN